MFSTLCNGTVIKAVGNFGVDYGFLSSCNASVQEGDVKFDGTAACIQNRRDGITISIGSKGTAAYKGYSLTSNSAVGMQIVGSTATLMLPIKHTAQDVVLGFPSSWVLPAFADGIRIEAAGTGLYRLTIPENMDKLSITGHSIGS